jgi:hypothetical protein
MEAVTDAVGKLWFLGAGIVAIAAYAVTIKVRLDYLEKNYDRQITALWDQVNRLIKEQKQHGN